MDNPWCYANAHSLIVFFRTLFLPACLSYSWNLAFMRQSSKIQSRQPEFSQIRMRSPIQMISSMHSCW